MVVYEESYAISNFMKSAIKIYIPQGVYLYMIEIDALNAKWGHYFDIYIMDNREILYAGPLAKNIKQINIPSWLSKGPPIYIYFTPNKLMYKVNGPWMVLSEDIKISLKGYEAVPEVDYEPLWEDDSFKEEWG